jgi:hypothetical protein
LAWTNLSAWWQCNFRDELLVFGRKYFFSLGGFRDDIAPREIKKRFHNYEMECHGAYLTICNIAIYVRSPEKHRRLLEYRDSWIFDHIDQVTSIQESVLGLVVTGAISVDDPSASIVWKNQETDLIDSIVDRGGYGISNWWGRAPTNNSHVLLLAAALERG